jgi:hypothetical protein
LLLAQTQPPVSSSVIAALLLVARERLRQLGLPAPTAAQVLEATGAGRSRAYQLAEPINAMLLQVLRPVGRPAAPSAPEPATDSLQHLTLAVLRFVASHPGCISSGGAERARYSDAFRCFIVSLRRQYAQLPTDSFAKATDLPLGTLKEWLAVASSDINTASTRAGSTDERTDIDHQKAGLATSMQVETVLSEWKQWRGSFLDFCRHIQQNWRVQMGRSTIATILEAEGVRLRQRRPGRSRDEEALRGSFETFFGGAQWIGDGTSISIALGTESFNFNLELIVDAYSSAFVGLSVRDTEDSRAVTDAYVAGIETTGAPPMGLLLDNRPSNHTVEVDQSLEPDTLRMRSTLRRAQNKASVEGAFGLFSQTVPALLITATTPREMAQQVLRLVATTWARAMNNRPRRNRDGRTRVDLYVDKPTGEQIAQARAALLERHRKQQLARQTLLARQDPNLRALLDEAISDLRLLDPDQHFRTALARYGRDAIVEGIAIFSSKRSAGLLPEGADIRYLLGIVRNISTENELHEFTEALIQGRLAARERALRLLDDERQAAERLHIEPAARIAHHADRAAHASLNIDRLFWIGAAADAVLATAGDSSGERAEWLRFAAARINLTTSLPAAERAELVRILSRRVLPIT